MYIYLNDVLHLVSIDDISQINFQNVHDIPQLLMLELMHPTIQKNEIELI